MKIKRTNGIKQILNSKLSRGAKNQTAAALEVQLLRFRAEHVKISNRFARVPRSASSQLRFTATPGGTDRVA